MKSLFEPITEQEKNAINNAVLGFWAVCAAAACVYFLYVFLF